MITPANGDTGEGLRFEIGACLGIGTLEVADGPELKQEAVIGFAPIEQLERGGDEFRNSTRCVRGGRNSNRLHVNAKSGLAGSPEPKTFGEVGLEEQSPGRDDNLFPRGLNQTIVRFLIRRRGVNLYSMVQANVGNCTPQELRVVIGLDHMGGTTYIDEKKN